LKEIIGNKLYIKFIINFKKWRANEIDIIKNIDENENESKSNNILKFNDNNNIAKMAED